MLGPVVATSLAVILAEKLLMSITLYRWRTCTSLEFTECSGIDFMLVECLEALTFIGKMVDGVFFVNKWVMRSLVM